MDTTTTTSSNATKPTPAEVAAAEAAKNDELVAAFRTTWAGRILRAWSESRSVWLDGGEYYDVLIAEVWEGGEGPAATRRITVCSNADSAWAQHANSLPRLAADVSEETEAAFAAWEAAEAAYQDRLVAARDAMRATSGCLVMVARGTKVPCGTVGVCTGVFDAEATRGGRVFVSGRARVSPVRVDGTTPTDRDVVSYTSDTNLDVLMLPDEVRTHWRNPVLPVVVSRAPVAELAWRWASRDARGVSDAELGARCPSDADYLRAAHARALFAGYADRLAALDADLLAAMDVADREPVLVEAGRAHVFGDVLGALESNASWRTTFETFGPDAVRDNGKRRRPVNLRAEAVLAAVRGGVGEVYEAPKAPRVKRAGKGATSANDDGAEPRVGAVA